MRILLLLLIASDSDFIASDSVIYSDIAISLRIIIIIIMVYYTPGSKDPRG